MSTLHPLSLSHFCRSMNYLELPQGSNIFSGPPFERGPRAPAESPFRPPKIAWTKSQWKVLVLLTLPRILAYVKNSVFNSSANEPPHPEEWFADGAKVKHNHTALTRWGQVAASGESGFKTDTRNMNIDPGYEWLGVTRSCQKPSARDNIRSVDGSA